MVDHLDVIHWFFKSDQPALATAIEHNYNTPGLWETPDTIHCLLDYPDKKYQVYFEGTFSNARNRAMTEIMGSDATLYMDPGWYEIFPEHQGGQNIKVVSTKNGGPATTCVEDSTFTRTPMTG